jgi:hypothetical protein
MDPDRTGVEKRDPKADPRDPPAGPTGPNPRGVDEAAGGLDNSPYEDESSDSRRQKADADRAAGRVPDSNDPPAP